jgi:zinc protease
VARAGDRVTRRVLPNGLTALVARSATTPTFSAVLSLDAGARRDPAGLEGLGSLLAGMLTEGTARESAGELAERVEGAGATLDAGAGYHAALVTITGLAECLPEALAAARDVVVAPRLLDDALEHSRRKQLADIAEEDEDPFLLLRREFFRAVYGTHPRGRPVSGTRASAEAATLADVAAHARATFAPASAVLGLVGDFEPARAIDEIDRAFSRWSGAAPSSFPTPPTPPRRAASRHLQLARKQTHILMGNVAISRSDPLYHPVTVMDAILGDSAGLGARLGRRLREGAGLAYLVESDTASTAGLDPGVFWVYTATSPPVAGVAIATVLDELRSFRARPPSPEEVRSAAAYLVGKHRLERETNEARAARLVWIERHGLGLDYDDRYPGIIRSVTADDVLTAARAAIDPDRCVIVSAGPEPPATSR